MRAEDFDFLRSELAQLCQLWTDKYDVVVVNEARSEKTYAQMVDESTAAEVGNALADALLIPPPN